jgi:hypothetical protein
MLRKNSEIFKHCSARTAQSSYIIQEEQCNLNALDGKNSAIFMHLTGRTAQSSYIAKKEQCNLHTLLRKNSAIFIHFSGREHTAAVLADYFPKHKCGLSDTPALCKGAKRVFHQRNYGR